MERTDMDSLPLVSVCIITYNSSSTVAETLEGMFSQTYPRLELLVSDDCSQDDTVDICRQWIEKHKDRFERTEIIVREKNGGVAANLNTVIRACRGAWIKYLAGDDILLPDCIQDNIDYVASHAATEIVFSKMRYFEEAGGKRIVTEYCKPEPELLSFFDLPAQEQYCKLLYSCRVIPGVTVFQKKEFAVGHPLPEDYSYCEDWPHWTHLTKSGIRLRCFDKETVLYRMNGSLSHAVASSFINERFHTSMMAFFYSERYQELKALDRKEAIKQKKEFFLGEVAIVLLGNRRNLFTRAILYLFKLMVGERKVQ